MDPDSLDIAMAYVPAQDLIREALAEHVGPWEQADRKPWARLLKQRYPIIYKELKAISASGLDRYEQTNLVRDLNLSSDELSLAIMADLFPTDYLDITDLYYDTIGYDDAAFNAYLLLVLDPTKEWDTTTILDLLETKYYQAALYAMRHTTVNLERSERIIDALFDEGLIDDHRLFKKLLLAVPVPTDQRDFAGGVRSILNFYTTPEQKITVFANLITDYPDIAMELIDDPSLVLTHVDTYGTSYLHFAARAGQPEIYDIIAARYPELQYQPDDYGHIPDEEMADFYMKSINPGMQRVRL